MNSPVQSVPRHVWQFGHVGEHRQLGLVTVFNIEEPSSEFISDETPRVITFINAIGTTIQQRDNGNDPLDVTFSYDSGYQIDQRDDQFTGAYKYAFEQGFFNEPTAAPTPIDSVDALIAKLRVDNPAATIEAKAPDNGSADQQVVMTVAAPDIKIVPAVLVENAIEIAEVKIDGPNAVMTFAFSPVRP